VSERGATCTVGAPFGFQGRAAARLGAGLSR